jgi:hypothetical protein
MIKDKRRIMKSFLAYALTVMALTSLAPAQQQPVSFSSYIELLRADVRSDKVALLSQTMNFNERDAGIFWPVYRRYEIEVTKLNDKRIALTRTYLEQGPEMSAAEARKLADQVLALEARRATLHKRYVANLRKAGVSPLDVIRLLQFEHRFDLLVDFNITSQIPALPAPPPELSVR